MELEVQNNKLKIELDECNSKIDSEQFKNCEYKKELSFLHSEVLKNKVLLKNAKVEEKKQQELLQQVIDEYELKLARLENKLYESKSDSEVFVSVK